MQQLIDNESDSYWRRMFVFGLRYRVIEVFGTSLTDFCFATVAATLTPRVQPMTWLDAIVLRRCRDYALDVLQHDILNIALVGGEGGGGVGGGGGGGGGGGASELDSDSDDDDDETPEQVFMAASTFLEKTWRRFDKDNFESLATADDFWISKHVAPSRSYRPCLMQLYLAFRGMQPTAVSTERVNCKIEAHIDRREAILPTTVEREIVISSVYVKMNPEEKVRFAESVAVDFLVAGGVDESVVDWPIVEDD